DLPAVAVGVGQPELVLKGVAAGLTLRLVGKNPARLELRAPAADLLGRIDSNAEVRERSACLPLQARLEGEVKLRLCGDELGVVRVELLRPAEDAPIERDRSREVADVEGDVNG